MKTAQQKLDNIQLDHSLWINELRFAFDEISIYEKWLQNFMSSDANEEDEKMLSNFLEDFISQKEIVFQLQDQIKKHIITIQHKAHANGELKSVVNSVHQETRERMEDFRTFYSALKEKLHRFASLQD